MQQQDKLGMKIYEPLPGKSETMTAFMEMNPEEFCEKYPHILVCNADCRPTTYPGYNKYIQKEIEEHFKGQGLVEITD